ncbi:MAG: lamin tail domain-containing protein [Phycisphaerae bacterium]|nr:lamin tail domain-containing protein [Phycisphaerae bacterium]
MGTSVAQAQSPVQISEFMASNTLIQDTAGDLDDWIELHNPTDHPVDVGGLCLTDDLTQTRLWQFPVNRTNITTIAAQGYLVVWADNDVNQGPLHASFKLSQTGEQIGLFSASGETIDTVTYPAQQTNVSWAFDAVTSQWYAAPYATPGQPNARASAQVIISEIMYNPSVEGERPEDPNLEFIELFNPGQATADLSGWAFTRGVSYVFPDQTELPAGGCLVVALDPERVRQYYGVAQVYGPWEGGLSNQGETLALSDAYGSVVNRLTYSDQGDWAVRILGPRDSGHRGWLWQAEHDGHGMSLELVNALLPNIFGQNWRASLNRDGTPGQTNSVADATLVPLIKNVRQSPVLPTSSDEVKVTATLEFGGTTPLNATLYYRVDQSQYQGQNEYPTFDLSTYTPIVMRDTGNHQFQATIPAQGSGSIVEFFVFAQNTLSFLQTWPAAAFIDGSAQQVANALYQVNDAWDHLSPTLPENQPVYYVIMTEMERGRLADIGSRSYNSNAQMNATFISALGQAEDLRYNVSVRNRGHGSRSRQPNNMRVNFKDDDPWHSVTAININSQYGYRQVIGSALFQLADLPVAKAKLVQLRINGENRARTDNSMYGSYAHVEVINSEFAGRQFPDDSNGNVYKCMRDGSPGADLVYRGNTPGIYRINYFKQSNTAKDDWSDLYDLTYKLTDSPNDTYLNDVQTRVHIDAWLKYLALNILLGNTETTLANGSPDDYYMYSGVEDERFYLIQHDLDSIFQDNNVDPLRFWNLPSLARLVGQPALASQYYGYLHEFMDTLLSPEGLEQVFSLLSLSGVPDSALRTMINYAENRYARIRPQIEAGLTLETTSPVLNGTFYATEESVVLFGTADPVATRSVLVNGHQAHWDPLSTTWDMSQWDEPATLVAKRSVWKYFDQYTDLGPDWYLSIDDSTWAQGPAQLGYGDGDEATVVGSTDAEPDNPGTQRNITTYFTRTFSVTDPAQYAALSLSILRDDAAVVYLNGVEIARTNMPEGPIDYYTTALRSTPSETQYYGGATGADDDDFTHIDAGLLLTGTNRLAVEIHQHGYSSSDISFDLELLGLSAKQGELTLLPGLNRLTARTFDGPNGTGRLLDSAYIDVAFQVSTVTDMAGTLTADTLLTADSGPFHVTNMLTVPQGVTLTLEAGTTVFFESNAGITVQSGGCIQALGTLAQPIRMTRPLTATTNWQGLLLDHTRQDNRLCYVDFEYGDRQGVSVAVEYASVLMDHVTFGGTASQVLELHHPDAVILHCVFPSVATEPIHGSGLTGDESLIFDNCVFGSALGYSDIIDFTGGERPGPIVQFYNNTFLGGPDDGLDLDSTDAHIQGNLFMNFHQNNSSDSTSNAVATGNDTGHPSQVNLAENIFVNSDYALLLKEDCAAIMQNNTIINMSKAAISFGEPDRNPPRRAGYGAQLTNNLFWNNTAIFEHYFQAPNPNYGPTAVTADYCVLPEAWTGLGMQNVDMDPMITLDGTLDNLSPAIGSGLGGTTLGAMGASRLAFSGLPAAQTWRSSATVTVSGPGITHYMYSLNDPNGVYSEERSVDEPIVLSNLPVNQSCQIYAIGKNSAGLWQGHATSSGVWQIQANHVALELNEILVMDGNTPTYIELYYDGPASLSGQRISLSQSPDVTDQFRLTSVNTLIPDSLIQIPLGGQLVLNPEGDTVCLFLDGVLVDSLEFGSQLPDCSVGRLGRDRIWRVTDPTPGQANTPGSLGNPRKVTLNEWLASPGDTSPEDFIELYNPSPRPVNLGGFYLTDNPLGQPAQAVLPPFTLVAGNDMLLLIPDGSTAPGHLPFKLSAEGEILGLLDPDLHLTDSVLFGPQSPGISQGRSPNGSHVFKWFSDPTPGQSNPGDPLPPEVIVEEHTLVPFEQIWSYNQDNQPLDSAWTSRTFNDSDWPAGPALLYVESSDLPGPKNTPLTLGASTYYFRTHFTLEQVPSRLYSLMLYSILDDGAIIYINGQEALRIGMPSGAVSHATYADRSVGNAAMEGPFELNPALLRQGDNCIAIEAHQTNSNSSDIVMGLQLDAITVK